MGANDTLAAPLLSLSHSLRASIRKPPFCPGKKHVISYLYMTTQYVVHSLARTASTSCFLLLSCLFERAYFSFHIVYLYTFVLNPL